MPQELFERIIKKWRKRSDPTEGLTLPQIANIALGNGNSRNASLVGSALNQFFQYFHPPRGPQGHKWKVNWSVEQRDHPHLVDLEPPVPHPQSPTLLLADIKLALDEEIRAVRKEIADHPLNAFIIQDLGMAGDGSFLYEAYVELPRDSELPIPEGMGILLRWASYVQQGPVESTLLSYDPLNSIIIFEVERPLSLQQRSKYFDVLPRVDELLIAVKNRLTALSSNPEALSWRLLRSPLVPLRKSWTTPINSLGLDETQCSAVEACLRNDITFVWGPPGTGKTHTLARLIASAASGGQKVIATAIANVAVDQLASKLVKALEESGTPGKKLLDEGQVLRFGHARLSEVSGESRLFPNKLEIQRLRKLLHEARKRHGEIPQHDQVGRALGQKEIEDLKKELRRVTKETIEKSQIVITTAIQTCIESTFSETSFDAMVIDEASMMPIPYLACMGLIGRERLVIAGDFRQLGPIALAQSRAAFDWLHRDAFELAGITQNSSHPALRMLMVQRRMHQDICNLVNSVFYQGKLQTKVDTKITLTTRLPPLPGVAAVFVSLTPDDGSEVIQTESKSRLNRKSADIVVRLATEYTKIEETALIGVIAPYRAQVSLIRRLVREQHLPDKNVERIKIGTVHAFQGSEADVIIWDLVDTPHQPIGKLYRGDAGNRLTNVAISRARGKLIIVGDPDVFSFGGGHLSVGALKGILKNRFSQQFGNVVSVRELGI
jgi:hypothetical protein